VDDGTNPAVVDDWGSYRYSPALGEVLTYVQGALTFDWGAFKIEPRNDGDIGSPYAYIPIWDLQYTTEDPPDSPYTGQVVTTEGVVYAVFSQGFFIADGAGAWQGIYVYNGSDPKPASGDRMRVTGKVAEYYGLTELTAPNYPTEPLVIEVLSSGNALPEPYTVPSGSVSQEMWESVLVRVQDVTVTDPDLGRGEWEVDDGSGTVVVDDWGSYSYVPAQGDALSYVQGALTYDWGAFKIEPRNDGDIVVPTPPPTVVINEILADPASGLAGDANGDGVRSATEDEFVEIVNNSDDNINISGWELADGYKVRHVFPGGTVVPAHCAIVVFGGGTPTGAFGGAAVLTASTGSLGLNNGGDTVTLSDGTNEVASVSYGGEGSDNQSLTRDPDITGALPWVKHSQATGSGGASFSPGTRIDGSTFSGCELCGAAFTPVYDVQGDGYVSPLVGEFLAAEGVVVGDFQQGDELDGFFIQDPAGDGDADTSDGVFVRAPDAVDVVAGEHVRVRGTVNEYYELTEIRSVGLVLSCGTGSVGPTPIDLPVPVDLEPYEGMLVTFSEDLTASQNYFQGRYGQVTLSSEGRLFQPTNRYLPLSPEAIAMAEENLRRMVVLDDGMDVSEWGDNPAPIPYIGQDNTLRAGDTVAGLTGVIDEGLITTPSSPIYYYRLHPTEEPVIFARVNERTTAPEAVGGRLKVAGFNVLNYFTTIDEGPWICGPQQDQECRGADSAAEFTRQRDKIIPALAAIDADVVGLVELENNVTDAPIADLVSGLNDAMGTDTYAYVATGAIGPDAIRVGLIYKPGTVTPVGDYAALDSSVDPDFRSDYNRPALAQTFEENGTGAKFTAVVNHLKSKGSPCDDIGDPDAGDGQGNCNLTRTEAAIALADWLATDPTGSGDPDFLIVGDLNAYAKEDPVTALEAAGYTNLVSAYAGPWAYSYTFDGQAGYLDHGLASPTLDAQVTSATVWHINTDEPSVIDYNLEYKPEDLYTDTPYRASDHDPVIVGLDLNQPPDCSQAAPSIDTLWPVNHEFVAVDVLGVTDREGDPLTLTITGIWQDEPVDDTGDGSFAPDGAGVGTPTAEVRAERAGTGNGRVYHIAFRADDDYGSCSAELLVGVPKSQGSNGAPVDDGALYDSTIP
jgi:predicted extracellular nuclease